MFKFDYSNLNSSIQKVNSSIQKVPLNLSSWSLMILVSTSHSLTTFLEDNWAVILAEHNLGVGMKVMYFENLSTITRIDSNSPTLERWMMKSRDTLSHGHDGILTVLQFFFAQLYIVDR